MINVIGLQDITDGEISFNILITFPPGAISLTDFDYDDDDDILQYIANEKHLQSITVTELIQEQYPEFTIKDGDELPKHYFVFIGDDDFIGSDEDDEFTELI